MCINLLCSLSCFVKNVGEFDKLINLSEYCKYGSRCTKRHLNPKEENRREVLRKKYSKKKRMTWHDANEFEPGMPNHLDRQPLPPGVWSV